KVGGGGKNQSSWLASKYDADGISLARRFQQVLGRRQRVLPTCPRILHHCPHAQRVIDNQCKSDGCSGITVECKARATNEGYGADDAEHENQECAYDQ